MPTQSTYPIIRGSIFYVDFEPVRGSEQGKIRPVVIVQNDVGNEFSPTVIVAALTSKFFVKHYPTNVFIQKGIAGLPNDSTIMANQLRTIDKSRLSECVGLLPREYVYSLDRALKASLSLN